MNGYNNELAEYLKEQVESQYQKSDKEFLNKQLERHGYVLDENSDVFVDVKDKCPACGAKIDENIDSCPACGLTLK